MATKTKKVLSCLVVCLLALTAIPVSVFAVNTSINAPEAASNETLFDTGNPITNIREAMDNAEDTYNSSNKSTTAATTTSTKIAVYSDDKSISDTSKTGYGLSYYADALRSRGYTVTQIYDPITSTKLDGYDALLIIGLNEYLSSSEKDAIEDFVENKERGLLLAGGTPSIVNDLAQKFDGGSTAWFGDYTVCDPTDYEVYPKWVKITSFYEHPITENVDRIIMYKGTNVPAAWYYGGISSCAYSDDDSWLDEDGDWVYDSGESRGSQPVLATSVFDKIVIVPDGNVFDNLDADGDGVVAFNEYDNRVLGLNIVEWLAGGGGSQEIQFKGTVTNIYSFYSATEYTIRVGEVISDPTNSMHEGDTAKVSFSSGSSAQVDSVEVGDKVEVRGVYTGYESGEHTIALEGSGSSLVLDEGNSKKVLFDTAHNEWWTINDYSEVSVGCTGERYGTFADILKNAGYEITEFNFKNLYSEYPSGVLLHKHILESVQLGDSHKILMYTVNIPEGTKSIGISINTIKETGKFALVTLYDPSGKEYIIDRVDWHGCDASSHIHDPVAGAWQLEVELGDPIWDMWAEYDFKIDIGIVPTLKDKLENKDYNVVILGAPDNIFSRNSKFTDEEIDAIVDFVKSGGNLLLIHEFRRFAFHDQPK